MEHVAGVADASVTPNKPYTASSSGVSGWISNTFSPTVVDDVERVRERVCKFRGAEKGIVVGTRRGLPAAVRARNTL